MATNGISKGTAAGIGVGAGLSGVMIGWLAFFFGRRDRFDRGLAVAKPSHPLPEQLGAISSNVEQLNGNLLDGRGDSEVIDALRSLGFLIQQHVESNYHLGAIPPARDSLDRSLGQLGLREDTRNVVVILALDPRTRFVAIRHLLAHVIFSNLNFHSLGPLSLLPPAVNTFIQSLPQTNIYARTTLASTALISWRRLTAFLMHQDFQSRSPLLPPPSIENQINELVIELGCFLSYFVDNARASEQKSRLESVLRACVRFGYEIFSHPCDWRFTFETETQNEVMVFPGLEKLSNREGELYDVPMKVALPEIVVEDIMRA